jgi:hypothetical protein
VQGGREIEIGADVVVEPGDGLGVAVAGAFDLTEVRLVVLSCPLVQRV